MTPVGQGHGASALWLTALVFDGPYPGADGVAGVVETALAGDDCPDAGLATVLALRWDVGDSRPRTHYLPVRGSIDDALLELVFAATFLLPLLDAATSSAAPAESSPLEAVGIDGGFINQVRDAVLPGTWALLLLATAVQVDELIHPALDPRPVAQVGTLLTNNQVDALRELFGADPDARHPH